MHLGARLEKAAALVLPESRVADIGADHAKLSVYLVSTGKASHVIASEKNSGPAAAAKREIEKAGLSDKIAVRIGDGLSTIEAGEVDTVVIAGMGGALMKNILAAGRDVITETKRLVLQPNNAGAEVRAWLFANGWRIADEQLVKENGVIYEIIVGEKGIAAKPNDLELILGQKIIAERPPLFYERVSGLLDAAQKKRLGMEQSERASVSAEYRELIAYIKELEGFINDDLR